jgi:hypothetical protein
MKRALLAALAVSMLAGCTCAGRNQPAPLADASPPGERTPPLGASLIGAWRFPSPASIAAAKEYDARIAAAPADERSTLEAERKLGVELNEYRLVVSRRTMRLEQGPRLLESRQWELLNDDGTTITISAWGDGGKENGDRFTFRRAGPDAMTSPEIEKRYGAERLERVPLQ